MRSRTTLGLIAVLCIGCAPSAPEVVRGHVTTDDGVALSYQIVGNGKQTVVVPMSIYLREALAPLAERGDRRLVFYDPRHRGPSDRGDMNAVSLDRQVQDLEQLRAGLGIDSMAIIGWSGLGMETAVYTLRHPHRVTRLVQVGAVPPAASIMRAQGDARVSVNRDAVQALDQRNQAGEFASAPQEYCRARNRLTTPANFVDTTFVSRVPDVCAFENEWPVHLYPYFGKLLGSFGDYDWRPQLKALAVPRLVIHGREDGIPLAGARAWTAGFDNARLLVLSPAGHFPFLERAAEFFPAVDLFLRGEWPNAAEKIAPEASSSSTSSSE